MLSANLPEGYVFSFEEYLFNRQEHRTTQIASGWQDFYWLDKKKRLVVASFHCHLHDGIAVSPFSATFGGIDFDEKLPLRSLSLFVENINKELQVKGAKQITITMAPQNYNNAKFILLFQTLVDNGYGLRNSKVASTLPVDQNVFVDKIHRSERYKLKQAHKREYIFNIESYESYNAIYQFLAFCRNEREIVLSMSEKELDKVIRALPSMFQLFSLSEGSKIIAAAICVNISSDILYIFYSGHLKAYNKQSPVVMLHEGIYRYAQSKKVRLIDFGTSHGDVKTDHDLLDFKQFIGCILGLKVSLERNL